MASFKFNGMIPDDDPRYQEGITIMIGLGLNEKSRPKSKKVSLLHKHSSLQGIKSSLERVALTRLQFLKIKPKF